MLQSAKVLGGVFVFGRIATANVATSLAHAQMHPGVAQGHALGACVLSGRNELGEAIEVLTGRSHSKCSFVEI